MDIDLTIRTVEFLRATGAMKRELNVVGANEILDSARGWVSAIVADMPYDTGNLRSGARPVWQYLKLPGEPLTTVPTGQKELKSKYAKKPQKYASSGSVSDRYLFASRNPHFRFWIRAAVYRRRVRMLKSCDQSTAMVQHPYPVLANGRDQALLEEAKPKGKFSWKHFNALLRKHSAR